MKDEGKFWFVWNPSGRNPRHAHETRESADAEAKRLAYANPGETFVVLKSVAGFRSHVSDPVSLSLADCRAQACDDIPF